MAAFNKVILIGHMTADPELKQTTTGTPVCSFSIGVNRRADKDGNSETDFINIVAWNKTAEFVSRYFKKGKPILVCGRLQVRNYTDNKGNKRYVTEVVADEVAFVESKSEADSSANEPQGGTYVPEAYTNVGTTAPQFEAVSEEEDLPF